MDTTYIFKELRPAGSVLGEKVVVFFPTYVCEYVTLTFLFFKVMCSDFQETFVCF